MDYEKALKRAKELWESGNALTRKQMEIVFPELRESEDERIRLISLVKNCYENGGYALPLDEFKSLTTWLEKQKEQKPADLSTMMVHKEPYIAPVPTPMVADEQKPVKYGDDVVEEAEEYTSKVDCGEYGVEVTEAYIAGVLSERNRKPAEWSEEDEKDIRSAISWLCEYAGFIITDNKEKADILYKLAQRLKSLPERFNLQPKQEWSEADDKKIGRIRSIINKFAFNLGALDVNGDYCEGDYAELDTWLKSLRPQPHWKPSEEQMKALFTAVSYYKCKATNENVACISENLSELFQDLKKLM